MIWLYRLLFAPGLLLVAPAYLRRMMRRGGYSRHFSQRLGNHPALPPKRSPRIWLQAVSVGELLAVGPLLKALHGRGWEVYLTTTTSTGYHLARDRYAGQTIGIGYFPIDGWPFSSLAWRRLSPDLAILTEGERWPEHAHQARKRAVPILCINARMSDRSFGRMRRFTPIARWVVRGLTQVLAASREDADRFLALGIPADRVLVTGNLKLDVELARLDGIALDLLRTQLGLTQAPLVVGASTWPGEESALLAALGSLRASGLACSLLLVPRHAERRGEIEAELRATHWRCHFRSRGPAAGPVDVAVGDTTGELQKFLQLADLVFVGKSLPPHTEGQTPVEAAMAGKAILFGPGMSNFRAIARDLVRRGAACEVANGAALAAKTARLLEDRGACERMGAAATVWREENRGALHRTMEAIAAALTRLQALRPFPPSPPVPTGSPAKN